MGSVPSIWIFLRSFSFKLARSGIPFIMGLNQIHAISVETDITINSSNASVLSYLVWKETYFSNETH